MKKNKSSKSNKTFNSKTSFESAYVKNTSRAKEQRAEHYLSQKKSFFSFKPGKDIVNIIITVAIAFLCTYFYLPWHGILSAIPFVVVGAFVCTFIKIHPALKMCIFFACPFCISALLNEPVANALIFGISCAIFYVLVWCAKELFGKKERKYKIISLFFVVLAVFLHVFENSTPWSFHKNKTAFEEYLATTYKGEPLYVSDIRFDFLDRTYKTTLIPKDNMTIALGASMKDGKIIKDEYIEYSEKYNMLIGAGKITEALRNKYPNLSFKVESNRIKGYPFTNTPSIISNIDYSKYMDFSVYFTSYNDIKKFSALAEECYKTLLKSDFYCRSITFYGGIGTRYIAQITVPFNFNVPNFDNLVTPCDSDMFVYSSLETLEKKQ